ncbi:glycosyltransferase family 2 protein [Geodermatophilus sp. CPCC 205506]|uniref:glycosyltransferase family 2 protein n=1 Tax=Geodermatophilus sp. CPCC 205506 TaxID=2936596 RepID=UPI003EEECC3D
MSSDLVQVVAQDLATAVAVLVLGYLVLTVVLARRPRPVPTAGRRPAHWVLVIPARDEEAVIRSTVISALDSVGPHGWVVVVDDASQDRTAELVRAVGDPRLWLLERRLPDAAVGKGEALNHAYAAISRRVAEEGLDPDDVVLGIVDADGHLAPGCLDTVADYFRAPEVGAVQIRVRIRNRHRWLGLFQDYEFLVFSSITQTARERLGSVGLGGNGQFARLSALDSVGPRPWSDCLTEDLDLGIRLVVEGWQNRYSDATWVDQQGVETVRGLLRQRTRWMQGHFQCWRLIPRLFVSQAPTTTVLDLSYYLMSPVLVLIASMVFTVPLLFALVAVALHPGFFLTGFGLVYLAVLYVLTFGPSLALCLVYRRRSGEIGVGRAITLAHALSLYNYVWYIAEWRALGRMITRRSGWTKTPRVAEPVSVT